jgi:hypothetical protein
MEAFTLTQWAIVALVFVAGWLLGLASHSGGRKWRDRYTAERDAHATLRRDADARVAQAKADADARVAAAEARHAELSREHDRLRAAAPVTAGTVAPVRTAAARPAYAPGERRGWFDWGPRRT